MSSDSPPVSGEPPRRPIKITVISGVEGPSIYINDLRVAGPKPWGGGSIIAEVYTRTIDVAEGLLGRVHPEIAVSTTEARTWHATRESNSGPLLADRLKERIHEEAMDRYARGGHR
jgi:hypothetical protein